MYRNKQWLKKKYFDERLLLREIADLCGVQVNTVLKWFKKFGLKARSPSERHIGKWNGRWRGGSYLRKHSKGRYIRIVRKGGKPVVEHRLIMEKHLGRKLLSSEVIHHLDGNSTNNDINNLLLFPAHTEHSTYEAALNQFAKNILFGEQKPSNHKELLLLFNQQLSKCGQDISA